MRHHRQEFHLRAICQLGLGARDALGVQQTLTFDRVGNAVGDELEENHVLFVEFARLDRAGMNDADETTRRAQGSADERR